MRASARRNSEVGINVDAALTGRAPVSQSTAEYLMVRAGNQPTLLGALVLSRGRSEGGVTIVPARRNNDLGMQPAG